MDGSWRTQREPMTSVDTLVYKICKEMSKQVVGLNLPDFWLLLQWIDSVDRMIQMICEEAGK